LPTGQPRTGLDFQSEDFTGKGKLVEFKDGAKAGGGESGPSKPPAKSVFDTINDICSSGPSPSEAAKKEEKRRAALKTQDEGELKRAALDSANDTDRLEAELSRLKRTQAKAGDKDKGMAKALAQKVDSLEKQLGAARAHGQRVRSALHSRKDEKKSHKHIFK
jgi:hypothetical protein